ncbi:MAG TPA: MoaD/ThiS family protein [Candidatus Binataceae bacterium]
MIRVSIPSPLHSYTKGRSEQLVEAANLAELTQRLDDSFPGIRFRIVDERDRIRRHIQFFVNGEMVRELSCVISPGDEVKIVCALSGG